MITITVKGRFEAAHILPKHPGKCSKLHGHSWEYEVDFGGEVDQSTGFILDFYYAKMICKRAIDDRYDHSFLGDLNSTVHYPATTQIYPTSENLVWLIAKNVTEEIINAREEFKLPEGLKLAAVRLSETCTSRAEWRGGE